MGLWDVRLQLGIPPQVIGNVQGIVKSYCTRVGEGPFPTELTGMQAGYHTYSNHKVPKVKNGRPLYLQPIL